MNRLRFCWLPFLLLCLCAGSSGAMTLTRVAGKNEVRVSPQYAAGAVAIASGDAVAAIYCDPGDVQPTAIAVGLLADDVRKVTGRVPRVVSRPQDLAGDVILVGTIGHSTLVNRLIAEGRLDVGGIRGRWGRYSASGDRAPAAERPPGTGDRR